MRFLWTIFSFLVITTVNASLPPPKLIVQLVIDQLRGDFISRYQTHFDAQGFNYLITHGISFDNARHPHANTVTCTGHATIATGSYPAYHGIIANRWYDRQKKALTYCVADHKFAILPTLQTTKKLAGRSPRYLAASTFSDELVLAQKGRAFAVSLKDRAAITLAGHAGKALWFDKLNGGFVSSTFYYHTYPQWVDNWNMHHLHMPYLHWTLSLPISNYFYQQAPKIHHRFPAFGFDFPHKATPYDPRYYKYFSMMPDADEITANFAIDLLAHEHLGQQKNQTDYLAISFSTVDAIGHQFGPNSLEAEDNLRRLDKTIARLLRAIDQQVGLDNTLIILTADHGIKDSHLYLAQHHMPQAPSLDITQLTIKSQAFLKQKFHLPTKNLITIHEPFVYINHALLNKQSRYSLTQITDALCQFLTEQSTIFAAFNMAKTNTYHTWLETKVNRMFFPYRTGDIYLVMPPYQTPYPMNNRVNHGSPWNYDAFVPLVFSHPSFNNQHFALPVKTTDIAITLTTLLHINPTSASVGHPLQAVLGNYSKELLALSN